MDFFFNRDSVVNVLQLTEPKINKLGDFVEPLLLVVKILEVEVAFPILPDPLVYFEADI